MYDILHLPQVIELGKTGENDFRPFEFDLRPWLAELPDGVATIVHIRPGETAADSYIAATTFEDGILTWRPGLADLGEVEGYGQIEIWLEEISAGTRRGKSEKVQTYVKGSIGPAEADPPEPQESWLEQMTTLKTETVTAKNAAVAAQTGAETAETGAVNAKNAAVDAKTEAEAIAEALPGTIATALEEAKESGEFDGPPGDDGYSPTVTVTDITGGHRVTITDKTGSKTVDVMDGEPGDPGDPGADGFSPSASVSKSGKTTTLTVTDKSGTTTAQVLDGADADPTTLIDDTAGEGDTDKTWSADKIDAELSDLNSQIDGKQDTPSTAGTAGQVLSLDSNLDPVWSTPSSGGGAVSDVQIDGTSILVNGVANIPKANTGVLGVVAVEGTSSGLSKKADGSIAIYPAQNNAIKTGDDVYNAIIPSRQHRSAFYGLAKAAGDTTQSASSNAVGTYTESAKSAISEMLNAPETVSGTTPSITGKAGIRYVCGECATLTIVAPASGCIDVTFTSGSTATVLTVSSAKTGVTAIKWANGFDPTSLEANTTYEINILDGEFGVVGSWT